MRIVALGTAAVLAGWPVRPHAQPAETRFVIAPGPEAAGAVREGADDVKAAQALARKKRLAEAVALLERVAAAHPAAAHDCNLALAYLRAGELTRAQLIWDVSRQRGTAPPDWCDSSLAGQLATALRDGGYVPVTLVVSPAGADVEIAGIHLRDLGLVWLRAGTHTVNASATGMEPQRLAVAIAPPSARATIVLKPFGDARSSFDDARSSFDDARSPQDSGSLRSPAPESAPFGDARSPQDSGSLRSPAPESAPFDDAKWPAFAGVGLGGVGLGVGLAFHLRALGTKDRANDLVAGTAPFDDQRTRFGRERALAIGGYTVSAAAFGFATWYWLRRERRERAYTLSISRSGETTLLSVGGVMP